ncbi:MAG TPA: hypothetical protein VKT17_11220 [Acidobacteriota bacterium]|nr:hypothetical protein [Acidobacteriota bacterium]
MRAQGLFTAVLILVTAGALAAAQDLPVPAPSEPPAPLFVRLSVYPTASLSRYDYNNDLDLYEIRIYAELRRGSQDGPAVADAVVASFGERLDYVEDHYEKRVAVDRGRLPAELEIEIAAKGRAAIKERFPLPAWLVLTEPRPALVDPEKDVPIRWQFSRFDAPVDVHVYDFRTGKELLQRDHQAERSAVIPAPGLPRSTIIRIYIIQSWLYKRYLSGPDYARGSEVNVIPWSQVFVRTK